MTNAPFRSRIIALALAVAAAGTPAAGSAQGYGSIAYSAKTSAILGGVPSRLAMITAQQQGIVLPAPIAPAARSVPLRRALLEVDPSRSAAPWTGKPDLFGSVALRIKRTPLDDRWSRVFRAPVTGSAHAAARALRHLDPGERVDAVNRYVNARVTFTDDSRQFGRADLWSAASDTLRRGRGDCEDYALAKMQMLRAAGIPARDMFLVIARDLVRMQDHAVLVVRADGRSLMLDNSTDELLDPETVRDYRPIFTFASTGRWTHGYRRQRDNRVDWAAAAIPAVTGGY